MYLYCFDPCKAMAISVSEITRTKIHQDVFEEPGSARTRWGS